jgi:hypothetical protein
MMTLEQATERALDAVNADDLDQLERALKDRAAAIRQTVTLPASPELAARLAAAITAGDAIRASLSGFRARTLLEIARLARLKASLGACAGPPPPTRINYRG